MIHLIIDTDSNIIAVFSTVYFDLIFILINLWNQKLVVKFAMHTILIIYLINVILFE